MSPDTSSTSDAFFDIGYFSLTNASSFVIMSLDRLGTFFIFTSYFVFYVSTIPPAPKHNLKFWNKKTRLIRRVLSLVSIKTLGLFRSLLLEVLDYALIQLSIPLHQIGLQSSSALRCIRDLPFEILITGHLL